jgi:hypothetical protein
MDAFLPLLILIVLVGAAVSPVLFVMWLGRRKRKATSAPSQEIASPVVSADDQGRALHTPQVVAAKPKKVGRNATAAVLLAIVIAVWWYSTEPRFSDEDVASVKASIQKKFEANGATVLEIVMVRESGRKLVGYAKISMRPSGLEVIKDCTATRDENNSIWQCR